MLLRCNWCRKLDAVKLRTAGVGNYFCCSGATLRRPHLAEQRIVPSYESRSKSRFIASALIFSIRSWRNYQIWRFSRMLLRATESAVSGHIRPAGYYLPTPGILHWIVLTLSTLHTRNGSCITLLCLHHNHKMSISYHKNGLVSSHQTVGRWFIFMCFVIRIFWWN